MPSVAKVMTQSQVDRKMIRARAIATVYESPDYKRRVARTYYERAVATIPDPQLEHVGPMCVETTMMRIPQNLNRRLSDSAVNAMPESAARIQHTGTVVPVQSLNRRLSDSAVNAMPVYASRVASPFQQSNSVMPVNSLNLQHAMAR